MPWRKPGSPASLEEYFEALGHSGRPRRPEEYFFGAEDQSIRDHLGERSIANEPPPRSPLWSRAAYDRYLEWALDTGTTPNGVFGAKLMWGYLEDFVSLLRNVPSYRDTPLAALLPEVFPEVTFVRVIRANKLRQAVSLWKAVQTATWRENQASAKATSIEDEASPPYKSFIEEHRRSCASTSARSITSSTRSSSRKRVGTPSSSTAGIKPILVLYENFEADYETSTLHLLERLGLSPPEDFEFKPRMKRQSDGINDDLARRYSELRLGRAFDLTPTVVPG